MKRMFDFCAAMISLCLLAPVFLILALIVRLKLGAPVFFRQLRPGKSGHPFEMIKFRTMTDERNVDGNLLSDGERLTNFGKFLRSSSLDELPELWNVLKGDMSLVGPRPLLVEYLPLYNEEQLRRHDVKPGMTGWAQINGRNIISWDEKFKLDIWYVDNQSIWLDIKILFITIIKVIKKDDITQRGHATAVAFTGTPTGSKKI